ncbi:MAG TPA: dATP/dGTP diphosphohydrolase domain-containing protein, partial [Salinarimonas sp.]|nr:dATP/dGTP diphosphohydrolase domain-containing protein [Salinarimonas sp.]
ALGDRGFLIKDCSWEGVPTDLSVSPIGVIPESDQSVTSDGGTKYDGEKVRLELVPPDAITALATVLTFGARKYAPWNWAKGFEWSRLYGALQRHLNAWYAGEHKDPETGYSHLWHALCCLVFLTVHEIRGLGKDDRPKLGGA